VSNLTWILKLPSRDTSVLILIIQEFIKPVKSLLRKHLMTTKNMFEVLNTFQVPSMDYLIKKEFLDFENLRKTVSLKEIQFRKCNQWERDYGFIAMELEKELGELYAQVMTEFKRVNHFSEL
jgi:hypothetical protein